MSPRIRKQMEFSKPFILKSTSAVSLHERFSQVLVDQVTRSRVVTFDAMLPQQRRVSATLPLVLLVKKKPSSLLRLQAPGVSQRAKWRLTRRRSVWERLGWWRVNRHLPANRLRGFWSFTNKYRGRARFTSTHKRRGHLQSRLGQRRLLTRTNVQRLTAEPHLSLNLKRGGATAWKRCKDDVPTKRQLDKQLDEYMSISKNRLDKQLDRYMSMSRSRLDAQLDEYMSMVGETQLQWD
ncbi:uncharacterized protein LOC111644721 [Seriola lalandi dorsalis]|uniref:uncharacterized protein LOC111644721 n=1 Tax=Seriola lalandi dorsalis TaxID=1841481 RepID=UPI000C6F97BD|nr:uncharacterized protein LOC111644721 [Seriola lalandi dorsalis]XP_056237214.1 uncharacterized protein LOC130172481 [Seriola aureovittata]XP_056237215.1 uncharacterized protein LOC130172481 [Seriola aureovittata]